jgi:hypothetical protein
LDKNTYEIRFCELISASLETGGAFFWTRPLGVKVQMVQKVQRVQRVKEGGFAANIMGRQSRPALKLASPCLQVASELGSQGSKAT